MEITKLKDNIIRELVSLREDLKELKHCQLQYFTLAVTSAGAILGFFAIQAINNPNGLALLAPLAVIFPTEFIFFDKATTITRITGYLVLLEKQLCCEEKVFDYIGYENALLKFRREEKDAWLEIEDDIKSVRPSLRQVFFLKTRHRYWTIHWYTFNILSLICIIGAWRFSAECFVNICLCNINFAFPVPTFMIYLACSAFLFFTVYTLLTILSLTRGGASYVACARKWGIILNEVNPNK